MGVDCVLWMKLNLGVYQPIRGSSYIKLPPQLNNKPQLGIVNIQNHEDEKCFVWSVLGQMFPVKKNPQLVSSYKKHENKLDMTGITFPVQLSQFRKFERMNKISINVLGWENEFYPMYISKEKNDILVNLLLISQGETHHYCLVCNLNRALSHTKSHRNQTHLCTTCFQGFGSEERMLSHSQQCKEHDFQKVQMPSEKAK